MRYFPCRICHDKEIMTDCMTYRCMLLLFSGLKFNATIGGIVNK